ncbi:MAG TPA: polysaccharide deacetylase family protein, partial [Gemmatimonadaceae bacterium]|nr:polysaccharide deacetylase family protein [Gemmatimonadaceae bacterium]
MRRQVKALLGRLAYTGGAQRLLLRDKALIVLFHRVDDRLPGNPISCTSGEFRAYCEFFARHFRVVSLGELLGRLARGADISHHLVITFDDGYRDNCEVAAPELLRLGLPACFFIATGFIGTKRVPWWDAERGIESEWMSWEQVRFLHRQGFEIGAHTRNHVDLGIVSGDEAREEIEGSRRRLEAELGSEVRYFSYPFGRREQLTDENRQLVRACG